MPDTGAPWNIPYVASTDLVSDWPADSLALANAIDAGLDAAGNAGIGTNVVQDYETAVFTTTSATYVDITNLSVSITLASASSKVLLMFNAEYWRNQTSNQIADMQFSRGGTGVGPEVETRTVDTNNLYNGAAMIYLDSPGAVGPHTYTVQTKVGGGTADFRGTVLIAIEVAG